MEKKCCVFQTQPQNTFFFACYFDSTSKNEKKIKLTENKNEICNGFICYQMRAWTDRFYHQINSLK